MVGSEKAYWDSLSAWTGLVEAGGLEPSGRDEELANHVRQALNSEADSLEGALNAERLLAPQLAKAGRPTCNQTTDSGNAGRMWRRVRS